jgi:hypothetical protein
MMATALDKQSRERALAKLDSFIARLRDGQNDLLLEHLQSARTYLLGAMPDEYQFSLQTAKETAAGVNDPTLKSLVLHELTALLENNVHTQPPLESWHRPHRDPNSRVVAEADKSELYGFFHGYRTKLGVFYPTHYIFAAFSSFQLAKSAAGKLEGAGFSRDELVAVTAGETMRFFNEMKADVGLLGELMTNLSRFFGTEEVFADIDIAKSHQGAGFLAVYCPQEDEAERVRDVLEPFGPLSMQLYLPGGVRSLWAGKSPGPQGKHPEQR